MTATKVTTTIFLDLIFIGSPSDIQGIELAKVSMVAHHRDADSDGISALNYVKTSEDPFSIFLSACSCDFVDRSSFLSQANDPRNDTKQH